MTVPEELTDAMENLAQAMQELNQQLDTMTTDHGELRVYIEDGGY